MSLTCPTPSITVSAPTIPPCPAPAVTVNVPPCPTATPAAASCFPDPNKPCPECTMAYLTANCPDFIVASKAAALTDYDMMVNAVKAGLCCTNKPFKLPACSLPYLERIVPDFVRAALAQGKAAEQVILDAIAIGLCSEPSDEAEDSTTEPDILAPGSQPDIERLFDPPSDPTPTTSFVIDTGLKPHCPAPFPVLPELTGKGGLTLPGEAACLTGWDRLIRALITAFGKGVVEACGCTDNSLSGMFATWAAESFQKDTYISRFLGSTDQFMAYITRTITCNLGRLVQYYSALTGCTDPNGIYANIANWILGVWERWIGAVPDEIKKAVEHNVNMACPIGLPSAEEANSLLATNFISKGDWECIQLRNGVMLNYQEASVRHNSARLSDDEILLLERKNVLKGDQLKEWYGNNGWNDKDRLKAWHAAQEWVPSPTDAIDWMLKDVEDPLIQDTFLLGAEFKQKYAGHTKEAFDWNGVAEKDANYIWRAHWRNMAPTTLYEMHKRLRPGWTDQMSDAQLWAMLAAICPQPKGGVGGGQLPERPKSGGFFVPTYCGEILWTLGPNADSTFTPAAGDANSPNGPAKARAWAESLATTGWEVSEALGQADYPPFWRERLLAISYNVLTRTDLRRAYETNSISEDVLTFRLQDRGYAPQDASVLTSFYHRAAVQLASRRPAANSWVKTGYDLALCKQALVDAGMRPDLWPDVESILTTRRAIYTQTQCINRVKKSYLSRLYTQAEAMSYLIGAKLDVKQVQALIDSWNCEQRATHRAVMAADLCMQMRKRVITSQQLANQLHNLGYKKSQIGQMIAACSVGQPKKTETIPLAPPVPIVADDSLPRVGGP